MALYFSLAKMYLRETRAANTAAAGPIREFHVARRLMLEEVVRESYKESGVLKMKNECDDAIRKTDLPPEDERTTDGGLIEVK